MFEVRLRPRIFASLLAFAALLTLSLNAARPDDDDDEKSDQSRQ